MTKVRGTPFVEAVEILSGERAAPAYVPSPPPEPPKRKSFALPEPSRFATSVVPYLQQQGIAPDIISKCMEAGILYESKKYHNCVFVGMDEAGTPRFACQRGIGTDFKRDVVGSDKRYGFYLPAISNDGRHLAVFEGAIDALSHATIQKREGWKWGGYRLSLGGTSPLVLIAFLGRNHGIRRIALCLDNDEAGQEAAQRIQHILRADKHFSHIRTTIHFPPVGKDYDETLKTAIKQEKERKQVGRQKNGGAHLTLKGR